MEFQQLLFPALFLLEGAALLSLILWVSKGYKDAGAFLASLLQQSGLHGAKHQDDVRLQHEVADRFYTTLDNISVKMTVFFLVVSLYRTLLLQGQWLLGGSDAVRWSNTDPCLLSAMPAFVVIIHCKWLASPQLLNAKYLLFLSLGLWILSSDPSAYIDGTCLKMALARLIMGVTTKHYGLCVLGNAVFSAMVIHFAVAQKTQQELNILIGTEVTDFLLLLLAGLVVRLQLWASAQLGVSLHSSSVELSAVCRLLNGLCDSVLVLDDSFQITEKAALSTLLLHGYGSAGADLAGKDFMGDFCPEDRDHVRDALSASACSKSPALALNASQKDAMGNATKVELFHLRFDGPGGDPRYLVGIREYQDFSFVAALGESSTSSTGMGPESLERPGAPGAHEQKQTPREILVFDATSLDILHVSDDFRKCCADLGFLDLDQSSLYDLSAGSLGHSCLVAQVQQAINMTGNRPSPEIHFDNLKVFGSIEVDTMRLEYDAMLEMLVGTLSTWAEPHLRIPVEFQGGARRLRSRSAGSKCSKRSHSSRSRMSSQSRRSQGSHPTPKEGEILALHEARLAL